MSGCVWYVSKYVAPPSGSSAGSRGYVLMRELAEQACECVIIASDSNQLASVPELHESSLLQRMDGLSILWLRTLKYRVAKSSRRMLSWIDFELRLLVAPLRRLPKPDVVVVSSLSLLTVLNGLWLRLRYRCRLVFEVRDIWPLTIVEEGGYARRNPFVLGLGCVEWLGYRFADAVVGTMPNLGEHVANVLGRPRQTHCIPMGVDGAALAASVPLPEDYVRAHFPSGKFVVAHVGSIGITNALDPFLQCARAMKDDKTVHFMLVGDGDLRERYVAECADLPNVTFAPRVQKEMVQDVLSHCDLVYFSTFDSEVWRYGQSLNKVIDYMYSGKPIVASYSGYPSMINEAGCGTFVPAGDVDALRREIARYASMDADQRETIGARGRAWLLQHRSYHKLARDYHAILFPPSTEV